MEGPEQPPGPGKKDSADFVQQGKVLIVRRQFQEAVKVCRLGLLAEPTHVEGRLVLGLALMALGRYDEVQAEMRVALERDPGCAMAHLLKGEALYHKRHYERALEVLLCAQDLDPSNEKVDRLLSEVTKHLENESGLVAASGAHVITRVYPAKGAQTQMSPLEEPSAEDQPFDDDLDTDQELEDLPEDEAPVAPEVDATASAAAELERQPLGLSPDPAARAGELPRWERAPSDESGKHLRVADDDVEFSTALWLPPQKRASLGVEWEERSFTGEIDEKTEVGDDDGAEAGDLDGQTIAAATPDEAAAARGSAPHAVGSAPGRAERSADDEDGYRTVINVDRPSAAALFGDDDDGPEEEQERDDGPGLATAPPVLAAPAPLPPARTGPEPDATRALRPGAVDRAPPVSAEDELVGDADEQRRELTSSGEWALGPRNAHEATGALNIADPTVDFSIKRRAGSDVPLSVAPGDALRAHFAGVDRVSASEETQDFDEEAEAAAQEKRDALPARPSALQDVSVEMLPAAMPPLPPDAMDVSGSIRMPAIPADDTGDADDADDDEYDAYEEDEAQAEEVARGPAGDLVVGVIPPRAAAVDEDAEEEAQLTRVKLGTPPPQKMQTPAPTADLPAAVRDAFGPPADPDRAGLPGAPRGYEPPADLDGLAGYGPPPDLDGPGGFGGPRRYEPPADLDGPAEFERRAEGRPPADLDGPGAYGPPADLDGPDEFERRVERRPPADLDDPGGYGPPADLDGPGGYGPPADLDGPGGYGPPADLDGPGGYGPPADLDGPGGYGPPADLDGPGGYGPPADLDGPGGYGPPPDLDDPGGFGGAEGYEPRGGRVRTEYLGPSSDLEVPDNFQQPNARAAGPARVLPRAEFTPPLREEPQDHWSYDPSPVEDSFDERAGGAYGTDEPLSIPEHAGPRGERPAERLGRRMARHAPTAALEDSEPAPAVGRGFSRGDSLLEKLTGSAISSPRAASRARGPAPVVDRGRGLRRPPTRSTTFLTLLLGEPGSKRWIFLLAGSIGVLGLAVGVGLLVRYLRVSDEIETKQEVALTRLRMGNFEDYDNARQVLATVLSRRSSDAVRALFVRVNAAIPFEFGTPLPLAERTLPSGAQVDPESARAAEIYNALGAGKLDLAAELAQRGRDALPRSALLQYLDGRVQQLLGKPVAAVTYLQRATELDPKDVNARRALGDALAADGKNDEALSAYRQALEINPGHVSTMISRARLEIARGHELQVAEEALRGVVQGARLASRGQRGWAFLLLARLEALRGKGSAAENYIRQAKSSEPVADPTFFDELAGVLIEAFKLGEAERAAARAEQVMPGRPHPSYRMAQIYVQQGRPRDALAALQKSSTLRQSSLLKARIHLQLGEKTLAHREVEAALRRAPGQIDALVVKAELLAAEGRFAEAEGLLAPLLATHASNAKLITAMGKVYLLRNQPAQAQQRFRLALQHDRHAVDARLLLADAYLAEGNHKAAHRELMDVARSSAWHLAARVKLADLDYQLGDLRQARSDLDDVLRKAPGNPVARLARARVLIALRELDAAEGELKRLERAKVPVALELGRLALTRGQGQEAILQLKEAARAEPPNPEAWSLLVQAQLFEGASASVAAARDTAQQMSDRFPSTPESLAAQGRVDWAAGRLSTATRLLQRAVRALTRAPRPPRVTSEINVLLGRAYSDAGRLDNALAAYDDAERACPKCPDPLHRKALALDEQGRGDEAMALLKRALEADPNDPELHYDLGKIYENNGQTREAVAAYRKYLTLNPPSALARQVREAIDALLRNE